VTESSGAGHVDLGVLADLDEGVAGPQVEQAARSHLEHCATCRERMAHLRTTRALLSALPPEPMPEAVQARVDAALANASVEASGTIVPMTRRTRVWNSPAVAGAAAVAAVVVLVGALVAGNVIHHGKKSQTASAPLTSEGNHRGSAADAASIKEWATGANYTAATLPNLVPRLVTGTPPPGAPGATSAGGGTAFSGSGSTTSKSAQGTAPAATAVPAGAITQDAMRANSSAVLACGTILAGGVPTVPVAVDFASWNGKPAVIFALPAVGHPELLDVWVVRSNCSTSSLDVYFRRIPRPAG
jgi:hypothetical protein